MQKKPLMLPGHALGFSLLEVIVALAILALSFTSLILVQGRSTKLASEARNISIATQLARLQLVECKRQVQKQIASVGDFKLEGEYAEQGYPNFKFECHAPKFNMKTPSASAVEEGVKKNTQKAGQKENVGVTSSVASPFITMIAESLGNSVRELVVIIRWTENNIEDEMRVVTHVTDLTAMSSLSRMLAQGAQTLGGNKEKGKDAEAKEKPEHNTSGMPEGMPGGIPKGPGVRPPRGPR